MFEVEAAAESEKNLLGEKVVIITAFLKRCSVKAKFAGFDVKLKCRGSRGTFDKSAPLRVPKGGGELEFFEPSFDVVFEGDPALHFELCNASKVCLKRHKTLAKGSLALAPVFKDAGLQGTTATMTVELLSTDDENVGWVDVDISCKIRKLGRHPLGLTALKVYSLPPRPGTRYLDVVRTFQDVTQMSHEYAKMCLITRIRLRQARHSAYCFARIERNAKRRGQGKPEVESDRLAESTATEEER